MRVNLTWISTSPYLTVKAIKMTHNFNRRNFLSKKWPTFLKLTKLFHLKWEFRKLQIPICAVCLQNGTTLKNSIYKFCFSFFFLPDVTKISFMCFKHYLQQLIFSSPTFACIINYTSKSRNKSLLLLKRRETQSGIWFRVFLRNYLTCTITSD